MGTTVSIRHMKIIYTKYSTETKVNRGDGDKRFSVNQDFLYNLQMNENRVF